MAYRTSLPLTVPMYLLIPTYTTVNGVRKKTFPAVANGIRINGTFRTFGGTERDVNGLLVIEDTATIETWYRPDITSGCRIVLANDTTSVYEIIGSPENIEMRNQTCLFKVSKVKGGA